MRAIKACEMQEIYINDILDYAKFRNNKLVLSKGNVNISSLLKESHDYFAILAADANLYLHLQVSNELPLAELDAIRMK